MLRQLRNHFIAGIIILLPLVATVYILYVVLATMDRIVRPITQLIFGQEVYGVGVLFSMIFIIAVGIVGKNVLGRRLISLSEWIMFRIPLVRQVYTTFKQIIDAVFNRSTVAAFTEVVLIEYPRKEIYQLGFVTNRAQGEIQARTNTEIVNVFVPTTPNPTSGMLVLVPKDDIIYLDMTIEEGIKLILSGGVLVPNWEEDHLQMSLNNNR